jgi:hypothetical protein
MLPLIIGGAILSAGMQGLNMYRSNKFMEEAQRGLEDLRKNPIKPYSVSGVAQQLGTQAIGEMGSPMGYTGAERNVFQNQLSNQFNTTYNRALNLSGGSGARAAQGILAASSLSAASDFAAREAALREQRRQAAMGRVGAYAGQVQAIDNANVQANIMAQRDLNAAIGAQRENIGRAWSSIGNLGSMAAGYGLNSLTSPYKDLLKTNTGTTTGGTDLTFLKYNPNTAPTAFSGFMNKFKSNSPLFKTPILSEPSFDGSSYSAPNKGSFYNTEF